LTLLGLTKTSGVSRISGVSSRIAAFADPRSSQNTLTMADPSS
jgi:hypothetical protein